MKEQEMKIPHSSTWAKIGNKNGERPNILDHQKTMSCTSERACIWSPASFSVEANSSWLPSLVWGVRVPPRCRDARLNVTHSEPVPQHVADGRGRRPGRGIVLWWLCLLCSSTPVFKRSCVANEWGHTNSTAQSKIGLLPGVLCIFPCIYPFICSSCPFIHPSSQIPSFQPSTPLIITSLTSCFTHVRCHPPNFWITRTWAAPPQCFRMCASHKDPIIDWNQATCADRTLRKWRPSSSSTHGQRDSLHWDVSTPLPHELCPPTLEACSLNAGILSIKQTNRKLGKRLSSVSCLN